MTSRISLSLVLLAVATAATSPAQTLVPARGPGPSLEWKTTFAYAGKSDIAEGSRRLGEISHTFAQAEGVRAVALTPESGLTVGAAWRRFDFSGSRADVPDSLSSAALKLGYTRKLSPEWQLWAEVDPGIYSDFEDVSSDDFNAPFGLRAVYAASRDLQWGFALFADPRGSTPVVGGVGVRWKFAPDWTLLAFLPEPRIEYAVSPDLAVYAVANIRGGTFRVAEDFGRRRGRPELDNQDLDFREIGAGVGARWKLSPTVSLNASVGWMIDRRFEFDDRDLLLNGDGAPSFQLMLTGAF